MGRSAYHSLRQANLPELILSRYLHSRSQPFAYTLVDWDCHSRPDFKTRHDRVVYRVVHLAGSRGTGYVQHEVATINEFRASSPPSNGDRPFPCRPHCGTADSSNC